MKMVKSLLLGSAAGLVAVTAGQAAELPVKARPVQYVKICSLYGAGFYYMPGTDMCIKIGGWVRAEVRWNQNGNSANGGYNNQLNSRATNNFWTRERGYITADAREETAYGVARGYIAVGVSSNNTGGEVASSSTFSSNRAFVQWAGFTAGQTVSFFDFYPAAALMINAGQTLSEDTGDAGWWVWAYTAQFGGGFSATLSAEERRAGQIINVGPGTGTAPIAGVLPGSTFAATGGYGGWQSPDVVANLRVDQGWGSAQVMGALHELNPLYYGTTPATGGPSTQWGWVVGGGLRINAPFISPGDYFVGEVNYTQGALKYLADAQSGGNFSNVAGDTQGFGVGSDCVFGTGTGCELTSAWNFNLAYEHYWTPAWHQSVVGGYMAVSYDNTANGYLCSIETTTHTSVGCNNNWSYWYVGSRLQWDVTKSFYLAVDVLYNNLDSATLPGGAITSSVALPGSSCTVGTCSVADQSNWVFGLRMHKDFLP